MPSGKQALEKLADLASRKVDGVTVTLPGQNDLAFSLRASALHPLQVLENVHQGQVRDEIRALDEPSPDDIQAKEKEVLGKYYLFTVTEPLRVTESTEEVQVTLDTELAAVGQGLREVKEILGANPGEEAGELRDTARIKLESARETLVGLREEYFPEVGAIASLTEMSHILEDTDADDEDIRTRILGADTWAKVKTEYDHLDEALDLFLEVAAGLARITLLYSISPFFLFRLLVQFKVEKAGGEVTDGDRRNVSGEVTGLLNAQEWVRDWLATKMNALHDLMGEYEDSAFFHVKGGRALDLLLEREGENDWDTSIVINPELPAVEWYALYNRIHDQVLDLLRTAKREFLLHVSENAQGLIAVCEDAEPEAPVEIDPDLDANAEVETATAKAEMIDIGIPRRDTIEAFEQWHHTGGTLQVIDQYATEIPVPGPLYFVDEYVIMVREALSGRSPSLHKTAKRIARMARALADGTRGLDDRITAVKGRIAEDVLPLALTRVDAKAGRVRRLMTFLLEGFWRAHHLHELAGLASAFDARFDADGDAPDHDPYPEAVNQGEARYRENPEHDEEWVASECDDILAHIAFAQKLSKSLEDHLRARAAYLGFTAARDDAGANERRKALGALVKALYTASAIQEERLEVQLVVAGSAAAYYHADYSHDFHDRVDELDPVTFLDLRYYCYQDDPTITATNILEAFVKVPLRTYVDRPEIPFTRNDIAGMTTADDPAEDTLDAETLYLTWPEDVDFDDGFTYRPVVVKISVVKAWPEVAFKWGYPVVALPELIRDYIKAAADAGDFEAKYRLRGTAEALQEMITHYERGRR